MGTKRMQYLILEILADEVKQGINQLMSLRSSRSSMLQMPQRNNLEMKVHLTIKKIYLKTVRSTRNTIQTLLNKKNELNLRLEDNLKMITNSSRVFALHIQVKWEQQTLFYSFLSYLRYLNSISANTIIIFVIVL